MAEQSLADKLAEYEKLSGATQDVPEGGALHYLAKGALRGVSALADVTPNLYNLVKASIGYSNIPQGLADITGKPVSTFMPIVGEANPVGNALVRNFTIPGEKVPVGEPTRPAPYLGAGMVPPEYGAAALEGAGAAIGQGPMGLAKAAPLQMLKQLAAREAQNAVAGGLAGIGAQAGGDISGGNPYAELAGGLIGGVAVPSSFLRLGGVTVGGSRAAIQTVKDIKAQQFADAAAAKTEPVFSDYVGSTLKGAAAGTPNAAENLTEGLRLRQQIPGFNPSVPEMAGSPGLIDMQKKFALLNPKNLNAEVARTEGNAKAVQDFYRANVPAAESPSSVRSSVNQSLAEYEKLLADEARGVAGKLPVANQMGLGTTLSTAAQAEKSAARPGITAAYQKAFDVAGDATVPAQPIVTKVEQILGEPLTQIKPSTAPQTVSAIKRVFGDKSTELTGRYIPPDLMAEAGITGKKEVTLQDLHDIRVAINQDVASAGRSMDPAASTRLYNLKQVLPEVDAAIAKLPAGAQEAYSAANAKYRDEFAPRFKEGANLRVFRDTSVNEPKILPDKVVSEYFKPDSQAGGTRAMQFGKLFGNNAEAKDAARTGILDIYRQKVVDPTTGGIDQSAHNTFLRDYGRTLDQYKGMGVDAVSEVKNVGQQAAKVKASVDSLNSLAKTLKFDTVDELANDALRNPKTMGNTLMRLSPEKRSTFNSMLLDKSFESGTADGMTKFLQDNQKTLSMTVPKEQLSAMQDIAKALQMTERAPIRGNIAAGGADMLKNASGISTATVFAQIRAVTGQRSSVEWAAINLAMPALNKLTQTSFANVMENALHSPESAVALRNYLMAETPQAANNWASRLLTSMKTVGKGVWAMKGPITKNFIGPQMYPENLARTGSAIESQMQQQP